jgi:hypothetical protein
MGAIDHLALAMGISLSRLNGRDHETTADEAHSPGSDPPPPIGEGASLEFLEKDRWTTYCVTPARPMIFRRVS